MENDQLVIEKLNMLIKLTAANVIKDKEFKEQVRLLSSVGLQPKEIADILDKTPNHIRVIVFSLKKGKVKNKEELSELEVEKDEQKGS